ncbi:MATH domain-containing protein At5g43560-like isoform X2 [Ananas comosus]|uniref:MATH domain-containing protein At5g43560-like isoform X2 n=1 Tax=Ananas comosus TaxID=4615 RepID=A0A6P5FP51_ANACO|nr:MATH domain-containing protein At5g43560-like isoform X2 [Ananas comosus]
MSGSITEDCGVVERSSLMEGMSSEQLNSGDTLAEWRSCEQVENGTPSTSPPYWDDDDDCGPKPAELFGRFTWKIESFSEIKKRELRSNAFEVGGYKWYILIYPQGCDVCNHLSLFLCVANHDKLLPGWSHFAQFTIAVVNKDPKKSKFSDTLHRFWKKEHDWGWKKFMELSKVHDGFVVDDCLIIKAQVQVIREKANRPFRCLDCQYRRELVRIYLSNVEQICRRFIEERRSKLTKLIEDKVRWSSFRVFWLGIDASSRRRMSRDKSEAILKLVVKHFFMEKEVTSTLVMDSLYSGLKALEFQSKNKKGLPKLVELEELPHPMVRIDKDMFVLADDVIMLLERAVSEPLPHQPLPPKDDKSSQNRTKDGSSGEEINKDSTERDERRLMELGRRTLEIFVLAHIFSRIEVAYQEAVALKRQEELIREEEAAGLADDLKGKRAVADREKRAKKKQGQGKQKRNSRKSKEKGRDLKADTIIQEKFQEDEEPSDDRSIDDVPAKQSEPDIQKVNNQEDASDVSDGGDNCTEVTQLDIEGRGSSPVNWDTDVSETYPNMEASSGDVPNGKTGKRSPPIDDSSSTCSTDSVPSVVMSGPYKGNTLSNNKVQASPNRGKNQRNKEMNDRTGRSYGGNNPPPDAAIDSGHVFSGNCRAPRPESEAVVLSLKDQMQLVEHNLVEKEEEAIYLTKKLNSKDQYDIASHSKKTTGGSSSSSASPLKKPLISWQQPKQSSESTTASSTTTTAATASGPTAGATASGATATAAISPATTVTTATPPEPSSTKELQSTHTVQPDKLAPPSLRLPLTSSIPKTETQKPTTSSKNTTTISSATATKSRPLSAPLIPAPRPYIPTVSMVQAAPQLSRSRSAAGRLGNNDPSPSAPSYFPQSYRNAIMGNMATTGTTSPAMSQGVAYSHSSTSVSSASTSVLQSQISSRSDQSSLRPGFTFGSVRPDALNNQNCWIDNEKFGLNILSDMEGLSIYGESQHKRLPPQNFPNYTDEFPHLDIINDLLDEEQSNGRLHHDYNHQQSFSRQYSLPASSSGQFDQAEQCYESISRAFDSCTGGLVHGLREGHFSPLDLSMYPDGQIDGVMQNQWLYGPGADLSMLNLGAGDANGYPYQQLGEYSNLTTGVEGYSIYRPAGGP